MKNLKTLMICLISLLLLFVIVGSASAQDLSAPEITFTKTVHDYGSIKKESDGSCEFIFKNTGGEPLIISDVKSSCGCTVPTWPKEPVMPGGSGVIKVVYDTKKIGTISKIITVTSNAINSTVELSIKGVVIE